jgi:hypothetical protein
MKKMHLLGSSKEALAITFDIMEEIFGATQFLIYPNINTLSIPLMPIKALDYKIMPVGTVPKSSSKLFIATPGPKNKAAIFNDFYKKHAIGKNRYLQVIHPTAYIASSSHIENVVLKQQLGLEFSLKEEV